MSTDPSQVHSEMTSTRRIIRGTAWNWLALGVSACMSLAISPFIVHHLGNANYGTWILANSLVAYLALLDLGMRGAVTKFVSSSHAHQRHDEASRSVAAAFWFRLWAASLIIVMSSVLAVFVPRLFQLPSHLAHTARWVIMLNGTTVAVALTSGVFGGVLAGLQKFDRLSAVSIAQSLITGVGFYLLLSSGRGIISMATLQLVLTCASCTALMILARRSYPQLKVTLRWPQRDAVRKLWGYSFFSFIIAATGQVKYYTDNIVIGAFLPVGAVAVYGIGASLTNYLRDLVASVGTTFLPVASSLDSGGNSDELRRLVIQGTRIVLFIALPVEVVFLLRGRTFIRVWMGAEYADSSGYVLQVLTIAWFFIAANSCSGNVVFGLGKHKPVALWAIGEAIANLTLSIVFVQHIGMIGVAWGTVIPSVIVNAVFWPIYIAAVLKMSLRRYIWQAWVRAGISVVPFSAACYVAERYFTTTHVWQVLAQTVALLPIAALGIFACFYRELWNRFRTRETRANMPERS